MNKKGPAEKRDFFYVLWQQMCRGVSMSNEQLAKCKLFKK